MQQSPLGDQPKKLVKLAHALGVKIALGTDAGVYPHGQNANEFMEYVEAGMTPMQALVVGTTDAALAGGIKGVGALEVGMSADVVAMIRSPLENISAVQHVSFAMLRGTVYKQEGAERVLAQDQSSQTNDV